MHQIDIRYTSWTHCFKTLSKSKQLDPTGTPTPDNFCCFSPLFSTEALLFGWPSHPQATTTRAWKGSCTSSRTRWPRSHVGLRAFQIRQACLFPDGLLAYLHGCQVEPPNRLGDVEPDLASICDLPASSVCDLFWSLCLWPCTGPFVTSNRDIKRIQRVTLKNYIYIYVCNICTSTLQQVSSGGFWRLKSGRWWHVGGCWHRFLQFERLVR